MESVVRNRHAFFMSTVYVRSYEPVIVSKFHLDNMYLLMIHYLSIYKMMIIVITVVSGRPDFATFCNVRVPLSF